MKRILLTVLLTGLLASTAQADDKFGKMDTSGDGKVTWEEFQTVYPQMQRAAFDAIDVDKKGYFTHENWHAFLMDHQKGMGKGGQGGMGGMPGGMGGMPPADHPGDGAAKPMITPPKK